MPLDTFDIFFASILFLYQSYRFCLSLPYYSPLSLFKCSLAARFLLHIFSKRQPSRTCNHFRRTASFATPLAAVVHSFMYAFDDGISSGSSGSSQEKGYPRTRQPQLQGHSSSCLGSTHVSVVRGFVSSRYLGSVARVIRAIIVTRKSL